MDSLDRNIKLKKSWRTKPKKNLSNYLSFAEADSPASGGKELILITLVSSLPYTHTHTDTQTHTCTHTSFLRLCL